jgi:hypothetical protein
MNRILSAFLTLCALELKGKTPTSNISPNPNNFTLTNFFIGAKLKNSRCK